MRLAYPSEGELCQDLSCGRRIGSVASPRARLKKEPWGQLAPKFLDLIASTNFWLPKVFSFLGQKFFLENFVSKSIISSRKIIQTTPYLFGETPIYGLSTYAELKFFFFFSY